MGRLIARINGWANRIAAWVTVFGVMAAFFTWLSSYLDFLKSYGWAEWIVAGFLLASIAIITLAAILVAWRFFMPLRPNPHEGAAIPEHQNTIDELQRLVVGRHEGIEARFRDIYERLNATASKVEFEALGTVVNTERKQIHQDLKNAEDARLGQISRIREETKKFSEKFKADDLDLKHLLYFAVLEATATFLKELISQKPSEAIPLGENVDKDHRDDCFNLHRRWVAQVLDGLATARCSAVARSVTVNAETEAVTKIRQMPESELPKHIHPLELRDYEIANIQALRLTIFLEHELAVTNGEMGVQRDNLMRQQAKRSPPERH